MSYPELFLKKNEDKRHITRCPNIGRTEMFKQTITELVDWMKRSDGDRELIETVHEYLILRGKTTMRRICATLPRLQSMARDCDRLGCLLKDGYAVDYFYSNRTGYVK